MNTTIAGYKINITHGKTNTHYCLIKRGDKDKVIKFSLVNFTQDDINKAVFTAMSEEEINSYEKELEEEINDCRW